MRQWWAFVVLGWLVWMGVLVSGALKKPLNWTRSVLVVGHYEVETLEVGEPEIVYLDSNSLDVAIDQEEYLAAVGYLRALGYQLPAGVQIQIGEDIETLQRASSEYFGPWVVLSPWDESDIAHTMLHNGRQLIQVRAELADDIVETLVHELVHIARNHMSCGSYNVPVAMAEGEAYLMEKVVMGELRSGMSVSQRSVGDMLGEGRYRDELVDDLWRDEEDVFIVFLLRESPGGRESDLGALSTYVGFFCDPWMSSEVAFREAFEWSEKEAIRRFSDWKVEYGRNP